METIADIFRNRVSYKNTDEVMIMFNKTQQKLHLVMRRKGFDVPIKKHREGSVLESEGSY